MLCFTLYMLHHESCSFRVFISDNFKPFKLVDVNRFCSTKDLASKLILESCPWQGGFVWTIDVNSKMKMYLSYLELYSVLIDTENVLNSHLVMHLSDEKFYKSSTSFYMIYGKSRNGRWDLNVN